MSRIKEPCFFNREEIYERGLSIYQENFLHRRPGQLLGEASTEYSLVSLYPETPKRLADRFPEAKILITLRDPVSRAVSIYFHLCRIAYLQNRKLSGFSFESALEDQTGEWNHLSHHPRQTPLSSLLVESGNYVELVNAYRRYFPAKQVRVLFFEDLGQRPYLFFKSATDFLRLSDFHASSISNIAPANGAAQWRELTQQRKGQERLKPFLRHLPHSRKWGESDLARVVLKAFGRLKAPQFPQPKVETLRRLEESFKIANHDLEKLLGTPIPWH